MLLLGTGDDRDLVVCCWWLLEGSNYVFLLQCESLPGNICVVHDGYGSRNERVGALHRSFDEVVFKNFANFAFL